MAASGFEQVLHFNLELALLANFWAVLKSGEQVGLVCHASH